MILRVPRYFMFSLANFAFIAVTVGYVEYVFTTTTRWIFLLLLALNLLSKRRFMFGLQSRFGAMLLVYCAWCIVTFAWSEVPNLSLAKAVAFSFLVLTFVSAGQWWTYERGSLNALNYLAPVTALALFAGVSGGQVVLTGPGNLQALQGLTENPNMLGSIVSMALPFLLWNAYKYRNVQQKKWLFIILLAVALALLARTHARASFLTAGAIGVGFCLSLRLSRTSFNLALIAGALLFPAVIGTAVLDATYEEYFLKGSTEEQGILFSRREVWERSYQNAQEGGWFGEGYGVTVGDTVFKVGLTAVGYGREKGNAQLAIVEETGVVGLALYSVLLIMLFKRLVSAHIHEKSRDIKVILGIVTGSLLGMTFMSVFEAWWVAPGSPESAYFWGLAGVGLCLAESPVRAPNMVGPSRAVPGHGLYPARF